MGNDMTWEQKCRISALRAACASQFTIFGVPTHLTMPPDAEADEHMTARILARAEVFRNALLHNGRLDDVDSFIERVSDVKQLPESNVCPGCGSSRKDEVRIEGCVHAWHRS